MSKHRARWRDEVSATELAKMGFCEKRVQLAHLHGERATPKQRRAMARGQVAHQQYFEDGLASTSDRRCFVATGVFGPDARETQVLRAYRDEVLLRRNSGRWLVAAYYSVGPAVCWFLVRFPAVAHGVRFLLCTVAAWCGRRVGAGKRT